MRNNRSDENNSNLKNMAVFGIYPTRRSAEGGVEALRNAGFSSSDVSVLLSSAASSKEFAHENSTKTPEGATTGALSGATVGGVLGWLAGIGTLAIPGVGPFIAAGPIMAALAGMGVGGALGGLTGALIGMGIPEYEAKRYEGRLNGGGILVSVHTGTNAEEVKAHQILEHSGAEDISNKSEKTGSSTRREDDSDTMQY